MKAGVRHAENGPQAVDCYERQRHNKTRGNPVFSSVMQAGYIKPSCTTTRASSTDLPKKYLEQAYHGVVVLYYLLALALKQRPSDYGLASVRGNSVRNVIDKDTRQRLD